MQESIYALFDEMAYDTHCDVEDSVVRKHFECATSYPEAFDEVMDFLQVDEGKDLSFFEFLKEAEKIVNAMTWLNKSFDKALENQFGEVATDDKLAKFYDEHSALIYDFYEDRFPGRSVENFLVTDLRKAKDHPYKRKDPRFKDLPNTDDQELKSDIAKLFIMNFFEHINYLGEQYAQHFDEHAEELFKGSCQGFMTSRYEKAKPVSTRHKAVKKEKKAKGFFSFLRRN